MSINIHGGGSRTNQNGLRFEQETSIEQAFIQAGFTVSSNVLFDSENIEVGYITSKLGVYRYFLEPRGIWWKDYISRILLPDEFFYNSLNNTAYIIEKKFQNNSGSTDEKLQTCDFKKKQYSKMFNALGINIEYYYILNTWFEKEMYTDVLDYIEDMGSRYFFNSIPIQELGL
jgi:hypothetical protein